MCLSGLSLFGLFPSRLNGLFRFLLSGDGSLLKSLDSASSQSMLHGYGFDKQIRRDAHRGRRWRQRRALPVQVCQSAMRTRDGCAMPRKPAQAELERPTALTFVHHADIEHMHSTSQ